ncbi:tetratricopeptide repeat protein [Aequorivita marina]|uniref:tetratricopeptide repeat protein n=1 Tax=Aequorivita marina TaxID=3073654 RepID=UPI0028756A48|nr:hypothetical protein [Aequorivita sp. S2608]MDS1297684.1 hypothetical protein [Aequorivita sp. S2608]
MKLHSFFKQCHKKEVFKLLSIYVVSAWVILQVLSVTWQPLGLPHKSVTFLIITLLLCFPLYIFLIWKYKVVTFHKAETEADANEKDLKQIATFNRVYFSGLGLITTLCVVTVFFIVNKNFSQEANIELLKIERSDKIAVLKFGNNTGSSKYDIVGKMASDWIIHGITENQVAQVITQDLVDEYKLILNGKKANNNEIEMVKEYLKPSKIITGNYYLKKGKLIFQGMLVDGKTNKTDISFKPTECPSEYPLQCIENLNESIIGYFVTEDKKKLMLQETPPKYEAYKYLLEAKNANENGDYITYLEKAMNADSSFFEPKVLRVAYYYNQKNYKKADSLLGFIKPDSYTNKRQLNLLNMYNALLKGDNRSVYNSILKEYYIAPFDLITNKTAMVIALQYVNKPKDVEAIYNAVDMDSMSLQNCAYCVQRIYVKAYADIELEKYTTAIKNIENAQSENGAHLLNKPLVIAYVRAGKTEVLDRFLRKIEITSDPAEVQELYLQVGKEFLLKDNKAKAERYFSKIIEDQSNAEDSKTLANALFYMKEYSRAEEIFIKMPEDIGTLTKLAICNFKLGQVSEAENNVKALKSLRANFQFGAVDYALAQYYAASNNIDELNKHLLRAAAKGHLYHWKYFKNDPLFVKHNKSKAFKEALDFWK